MGGPEPGASPPKELERKPAFTDGVLVAYACCRKWVDRLQNSLLMANKLDDNIPEGGVRQSLRYEALFYLSLNAPKPPSKTVQRGTADQDYILNYNLHHLQQIGKHHIALLKAHPNYSSYREQVDRLISYAQYQTPSPEEIQLAKVDLEKLMRQERVDNISYVNLVFNPWSEPHTEIQIFNFIPN